MIDYDEEPVDFLSRGRQFDWDKINKKYPDEISMDQACEILNESGRFLIKRLREGQIRYRAVTRHKIILLLKSDVMFCKSFCC